MKMKKLVCLDAATLYPAKDPRWNHFRSYTGSVEIYDRSAASEILPRLQDADAVLTNKTPLSADTIAACPYLRYIGVLATGFNIVDVEAACRRGITVTNIPAYSTRSVAQTAISLLLAISNRPEHYTARIRNGAWSDSPDFSFRDFTWHELSGKTMAIVGFGNIGRATAAIAAAMGMNISVVSSKDKSELPEEYTKVSLDEAFATADVLSLHCPLTPETAKLVDYARLSTMKPTAILINTARGGLVDENALAEALESGTIAAAGLDVLSSEPPAKDNPLLKAPNCMITPHIAWASHEARLRLFSIASANLESFIEGKPENVVLR